MARIVTPGQAHRVFERGNRPEADQDVLFVEGDRRAYLKFLREHCERLGFHAAAYCRMTNPSQLVGRPALVASL